jgi:N-acetylglucosaminyldiphosphoundecaprenol N-acetyl-beta-D-mannosaminyltransferase
MLIVIRRGMGSNMAGSASLQPDSTFDVLGVPVSVTSLADASARIRSWSRDRVGRFVCIRDVHGIMQARSDPALLDIHQRAAMVTPDGMPLVWVGRRRGLPVQRTCGPDLIERLVADGVADGLRHYFFGGKPGVAERLAANFADKYPRLRVVGTETPPFWDLSDTELRELARRIIGSGADIVWIGLSTPRQEFLMDRLVGLTPATLIGVGAAYDFHTGAVKRAPRWMQKSGLEWSFRLVSEPRRLWRRYLVMAPKFVWAMAFDRKAR